MKRAKRLPFLITGEHVRDVGQIDDVLINVGQPSLFVPRWEPTEVAFSHNNFGGLIILGDTRHWATSIKYRRDREWLATALAANRPVLGICYGAQLMAAHLAGIQNGRSLSKNPHRDHVGKIVPIELRGEGLTDPVVEPLRHSPFTTTYHEDCFQEPPSATALAWSTDLEEEHCEAFRVGPPERAVYGVQFHPEPDREMLENDRWFKESPDCDRLRATVATGRALLERWVWLAIKRT